MSHLFLCSFCISLASLYDFAVNSMFCIFFLCTCFTYVLFLKILKKFLFDISIFSASAASHGRDWSLPLRSLSIKVMPCIALATPQTISALSDLQSSPFYSSLKVLFHFATTQNNIMALRALLNSHSSGFFLLGQYKAVP